MSEAPDQLAGAEAPVAEAPAGVEAVAPAATPEAEDIDTDAFDRAPAPPEDAEDAPAGQAEGADGEDKPAETADDDTFEFDLDGQKVKLPKSVQPFLLMQSDYTKKTQEVAEQRREIETKAEELASREAQQAESLKAFRAEHTAIGQYEQGIADIDAKLAEYAKISPDDWNALRAQKPEEYEAHRANRQLLRDSRADYAEALGKAQDDLKGKEIKFVETQQAARSDAIAKAWQQTNARLSKDIPNWSPARGQELATIMAKELGVTTEELQEAVDPRVWIIVDKYDRERAKSARLETSLKQTTATESALKSQTVTPAAKPAGGAAPPRGVNDGISTEEWMKRRNAQVAKQRA